MNCNSNIQMVKKYLSITVIVVCFFVPGIIYSQISSIRFEHLTIEDGLSQSSVRAIYQDKFGFMWFGTNDGLNRYDGYNFKIFKSDIYDSSSISNDYIFDIDEDSDGYLWIATSGGLNRFDPVYGTFKRYNISGRIPNTNFSNSITSVIAYNDDEDRIIWFTTRDGIFRYDIMQDSLKFFAIPFNNKFNKIDKKIFLHRYHNKEVWAAVNMDGIYKLNDNGEKFIRISTAHKDDEIQLSSIYEDKDNVLWFGSIKGLNRYKPETGEIKHYKTQFEKAVGKRFETGFINAITEDDNGNLMLATSGYGLILFNKTNENISVYTHDPYDERTMSLNVVHTLYKDRSRIMWIGTDGKGIDKLNPYFNNFKLTRRTIRGTSINSVRTFFEDAEGFLWISGYTGIDRYNPQTREYKSFFSDSNNPSSLYLNDIVYTIIEDKNNPAKYLFMGTEGSGVYKYGIVRERFGRIYYSETDPGDNIILCLLDEGKSNLWIGTNNGLIKFDKSSGSTRRFTHSPDDPASIRPQKVTAIFEDSYNNFWIGTDQGGLNLMDRDNSRFSSFFVDPLHNAANSQNTERIGSISGNFIKCIYEDKNRTLWIGTTTGLNKFIKETNSFKKYTKENGLPNNVIYGILEDDNGNLWLSTNYGISIFDTEREIFKNYDYHDGLQSNEFNTNAYYKTQKGEMFFGGIKGFNSFHPQEIKENKNVPLVVITDFQLFNQSLSAGTSYNDRVILKFSITTTDLIELNYEENVFSLEFASLDYSSPGKNLYSYKLEGFDDEWSKPSPRRTVTYTNLNPGEYTFRVVGSNNDGIWSKEEAKLTIIVQPPFWLTWWFFLIVVLTIAGILYSLFRYRVTKILEVERLRTSIASDLHDDIGSTLSKISMQAELLQQGIDTGNQEKILSRISEMSRNVISTMQDIVWSIDSRNDSFENLINKMKDYSYGLLSDKNIEVDFIINTTNIDHRLPVHVRQNLFLILKEAVHNVAKHSHATKVVIKLTSDKTHLEMTICDNGNKCNVKEFNVGHGLKNMRMRSDKIGAEFMWNYQNGFLIKVGKIKLDQKFI